MFAPRYFAPRYFAPRFWPPGGDTGFFIDGQKRKKKKKLEDAPYTVEIPEAETVAESMAKALRSLDPPKKGKPSGRRVKTAIAALHKALEAADAERVRQNLADRLDKLEEATVTARAAQDVVKSLRAELAHQRRLRDDDDAIVILLMN